MNSSRQTVVPRMLSGRQRVEVSPQRRRELFAAFATSRDRALRDELVFMHLGMVRQLAVRFASRSELLDDLVQVGIVGLINAIDRFDPNRGVEFSSFAVPTIVGEIKRHFRDRSWAMGVPRRLKDLNVAINRAMESLVLELGRPVTPADLATRLNVSVEDILEAQETSGAYALRSLDADVGDSTQTIGEYLGADDPNLNAALDTTCLRVACTALDPRERVIIYLRFFQSVSQSEIARRMHCTQMHVSRLQRRAIEKLRIASRSALDDSCVRGT